MTGLAGIGIWTVLAMIPVAILFGVGFSVRNGDATLSAVLIAIAVGAILLVSAVSLPTQQIFSVVLYRYANEAPDTAGFAAADLEDRSTAAAAAASRPARLTSAGGRR